MRNKKFSSIVAILAATIAVFSAAKFAQGATESHIIINEIQTAGASSNDEFVELFNPTDTPVILDGFKLSKKTKTGSESTLLSSATSTKFLGTIPAHGYFLIAHPDYKGSLSADLTYSSSSSISSDNTLLLYDKSGTLLDKVGFGAAIDSESSPASNPNSNQSIERNDFADTNNNAADFSINSSPSPQNSTFIESGKTSEPDDAAVSDQSEKCATSSKDIKLNEVFPYPETSDQEFIELKNLGEICVDLSGWKITNGKNEIHKYTFPQGTIIQARELWHTARNFSLNHSSPETIRLLDSNGDEIDKASYDGATKNYSLILSSQSWNWTTTPTPGAENIFTEPENSENITGASQDSNGATDYADATTAEKVYLNEILPNPKGDSKTDEYIELANQENEEIDLYGWTLRNATKTAKYIFQEHTLISSGKFLAVYRSQFKFALNNSQGSVYLYNPQKELVSSVNYQKAPEEISYNFDGKNWRWSKYLTPGKENRFDSPPKVDVKKPKHAYKDLLTEFSATAKDKETKKLKYSWNFGDGSKSTLAKTSHKYLSTGKFAVTLSVTDDSQTVEKSFSIEVKKYPRPNIEIVKIVPNPAGKDSENETIDVQNNSGKQIDLAGWKIATGSGDKIFNHPISGEFSIGSNETKTITQEFSKFSLNNKAGKVQLAGPDGKVIDEIEYAKEKIAEDEAYVKMNSEWRWLAPNAQQENVNESDATKDATADNNQANAENSGDGEVLGATDESQSNLSNYKPAFNSESAYIFLSRINFVPLSGQETRYCSANNPSSTIAYLIASLI